MSMCLQISTSLEWAWHIIVAKALECMVCVAVTYFDGVCWVTSLAGHVPEPAEGPQAPTHMFPLQALTQAAFLLLHYRHKAIIQYTNGIRQWQLTHFQMPSV